MNSNILPTNTILQGGRYQIINTLGQGGFGITYLARQTGLDRKVAIKEFFMKDLCNRDETTSHVSVGSSGSIEMVNRFKTKFLKEARNIARLNHPNIISIFDLFEENGTAYYVMEYAERGSLASIIKEQGHLTETIAINYICQIAKAIEYIHQKKMNHLDIKPANIMISEIGEAILIDFGLSKQYDSLTGSQTSTTPVGISEGYAPMEQYKQGGVEEFTPETDIYALGATFFKMLTGITPPCASDIYEDGVPVNELTKKNVSAQAISTICKSMEGRRKERMKEIGHFLNSLNIPSTVNYNKTDIRNIKPLTEVKSSYLSNSEETTILNISQLKPKLTFNVKGVMFDMIQVQGGTFQMGGTQEMSDRWSDELPVHEVTLNTYYIGETVVTQNLWETVMGNNPSFFKGGDKPVENVSWNECQTFISELKSITGRDFRLPSEAEWEFAARGGNESRHTKFSGSDNIDTVAWYEKNSNEKTHDVAKKLPNELGIYDMSGNVWEWCNDWYDIYSAYPTTNPTGPYKGMFRVGRGGCWSIINKYARNSTRNHYNPGLKLSNLGFRLCLSE